MHDLKWKLILPDVFYVWSEAEERGVVYSPLQGSLFEVFPEGMYVIEDYLLSGSLDSHPFHTVLENFGLLEETCPPTVPRLETPFAPTHLTLSLTSACNLRCIYCYAGAGDNPRNLSWEAATRAIDTVLQYTEDLGKQEIFITFHGGGEPTVLWRMLVSCVEYVLTKLPNDWRVYFSLVTNGTLISRERAQWLASHQFRLTVSFDGLEELQNHQRPKANGQGSFDDLVTGVRELVKADVEFSLRATITGANQHQLVELVLLADELECKEVSVIPVSTTGRAESGVLPVDPSAFLSGYHSAQRKAEQLGVEFSTFSGDLDNVSARYCGADGNQLVVLPDGALSACTRVTKHTDALSDLFFLGHWAEDGLVIQPDKIRDLRSLNLYSFSECTDCFARFVCSGGCHHERLGSGTSAGFADHCMIVRGVIWLKLLDRLQAATS